MTTNLNSALSGLMVLLVCQLAGELISHGLGLPVPGPVIGLMILLAALEIRGRRDNLDAVADGLLRHLPLLFVPAGVGVVRYRSLIAREWPAIVATLLASTAITVVVAGTCMQLMIGRVWRRDHER